MSGVICYREGYKYQVAETCRVGTGLLGFSGGNDYVRIGLDGWLEIRAGYAWDGASGPAVDTRTIIRGSLVHDALYQLIREETLPPSERAPADRLFRALCLEDGMSRLRAWWLYRAVCFFGAPSADPRHRRRVLTAP